MTKVAWEKVKFAAKKHALALLHRSSAITAVAAESEVS